MSNRLVELRSGHAEPRPSRILLYSHDTFGLGHLRRSRTIAQALVAALPDSSALILTGSPVAGRFDFPDGVDHLRLPGVVKAQDGSYAAQNLHLPVEEVGSMRAEIIRAAVRSFRPTLVIVDKEPTGLHGEMLPALEELRGCSRTRVVLGLRDVLDSREALEAEWERKGALPAIRRYYDEVWIYGTREVFEPLAGLDIAPDIKARLRYAGYLRRGLPSERPPGSEPYILVTAGGGGDGVALVDWTLAAYEADPGLSPRALVVYGPFLDPVRRAEFDRRIKALDGRVEAIGFHSRMEELYAGALGVVAMGGYNTFCEILSFDKPAVIAPRTKPRMEQHIRAGAAEALGLARMLDPDRDGDHPLVMAGAIRALATQPPPSASLLPGLLGGLDSVVEFAGRLLDEIDAPIPRLAVGGGWS